MSENITRTITTDSIVKGFMVEVIDGEPHVTTLGPVKVSGKPNETQARIALKRAGYLVPRGTAVSIEEGSKKTYTLPLDKFIEACEQFGTIE